MARHHIPTKGGDEVDLFSRWRHWLNYKPGEKKRIKRQYSKRLRAEGKRNLHG